MMMMMMNVAIASKGMRSRTNKFMLCLGSGLDLVLMQFLPGADWLFKPALSK